MSRRKLRIVSLLLIGGKNCSEADRARTRLKKLTTYNVKTGTFKQANKGSRSQTFELVKLFSKSLNVRTTKKSIIVVLSPSLLKLG